MGLRVLHLGACIAGPFAAKCWILAMEPVIQQAGAILRGLDIMGGQRLVNCCLELVLGSGLVLVWGWFCG